MKLILALSLSMLATSAFSKEINMKISGMVCSMCAQGIQKKFSNVPEVHHVNVDLDSKSVSIGTKDDADIPDAKLKELIKEAGYNVTSIERK